MIELKSLNRPLVITGCPRSGTTYASKYLQANGFDVRHEELGPDGVVGWCIGGGNSEKQYGPSYNESESFYQDPIRLHQVREPLACISSLMTINDKSMSFFRRAFRMNPANEGLLSCAMKIWYYWNLKCEEVTEFTYKVEDIDYILLGDKTHPDKKENGRAHDLVSWGDLTKTNLSLTYKIVDLASDYGYVGN